MSSRHRKTLWIIATVVFLLLITHSVMERKRYLAEFRQRVEEMDKNLTNVERFMRSTNKVFDPEK